MRAAALVLLVGLLLGLVVGPAACGNDDDSSDDPPPTTTTPDPKSEVKSAYLAYWEMGARLLEAPDPADPEIPERASGEALADLVAGLDALKSANLLYRLGALNSHEVMSVETADDSATAEVCVVDDSQLVDAPTGDVKESGITSADWTVTLLRSGGQWRVDAIVEGEVQEGAGGCG